jgi:alkylation response protein AidB-like acyl-CoA dehydrogenase
VPAAYTFSVFTDEPRQPEPLYRYPFGSIAQLAFASVALGIGRHAIEEFAAASPTRRLARARTALHADPTALEAFAEAEALLRSARALFYETAEASWATVEHGRRLSRADQDAVHLAAVHAAASARKAVLSLAELSGTAPLYMQSALGRCARDIEALVTHSSLSPLRMRDLGRSMLARARRAPR